MKSCPRRAFIALLLAFMQCACYAGVSSAAIRETAELITRKFGKEVAEESAEALGKQVAEAGAKYGEEGLVALAKVGPRTFTKLTIEAGEHSSSVVRLVAKHGDEAVWVISKPNGMAIFIKYGEQGATAVMKHPGVAENAIERLGAPAARALNAISTPQARRLGMMVEDGAIQAGGKSAELLEVVTKYGDRAMEFIWKNKGSLVVAASLAAFLNDPEPFINGGKDIAVGVIKPIGVEVARLTNWTPVMIVGVLAIAGLVALRMRPRTKKS
jgi:hypothetical protein